MIIKRRQYSAVGEVGNNVLKMAKGNVLATGKTIGSGASNTTTAKALGKKGLKTMVKSTFLPL